MSLATRCPDCGTIFRVVQDQLRVSEGWVRCGRCSAAFNAIEALVELDHRRDTAAIVPPMPASYVTEEAWDESVNPRLLDGTTPAAAEPPHADEQQVTTGGDAAPSVEPEEPTPAVTDAVLAAVPTADAPIEPTPGATVAPVPPLGVATPRPTEALPIEEMVEVNRTESAPPPTEHHEIADGIEREEKPVMPRAIVEEATESSATMQHDDAPTDAGGPAVEAPCTTTSDSSAAEPVWSDAQVDGPVIEGPVLDMLSIEASIATSKEADTAIDPVLDLALAGSAPGSTTPSTTEPAAHTDPLPGRDEAAGADRSGARPSFLRRAERAERWKRPAVRAWLALLCLLAAIGLTGQALYTFRDMVVARVPALRPTLVEACSLLGCELSDLRHIDALSVESSGLVRIEGQSVYRLSVTLRNRALLDVAVPALDLQLTDSQGRLISRRVLVLSELGVSARTIRAGSELPLQASLGVGDRAVSGYTVEVFYP